MRSLFKTFVSLAACIGFSACASTKPTENYLDAGARQHIQTVDAVLFTQQHEIAADVKKNSTLSHLSALAAPVTVLPMLLDAGVLAVNSIKADQMAKPMRKKLEGHDYPWEFRKQVKQSLQGTTLDGVDDFMIVRNDYPGQRGKIISDSDADAVLLVDMKYGFTPNFETLYLGSFAMLFPKNPELKPFQETPDRDQLIEISDNIYRNQFAVGINTGLKDASTAEHAAKWAEMSTEKLVELLDEAALLMADTIANDVGIDDLESDLNLIPEGYALNTKFDNFNRSFANLRAKEAGSDTPPDERADTADPDVETDDINASVVDSKIGS